MDPTTLSSKPRRSRTANPHVRSAIRGLLLAWAMPAQTARLTGYLPLRWAYSMHLLAVLLALVLCSLGVAFIGLDELRSLAAGYLDRSLGVVVLVVGGLLGVESASLFLAAAVAAWGARVEPLADGFRHSLRQTWLHTSHVPISLLLVGGLGLLLVGADRSWRSTNRPPKLPPSPSTLNVWSEEYALAAQPYLAEQRKSQQTYEASRPWYLRSAPELVTGAAIACCAWGLWSLLRGVGTRTSVRELQRPLMCESCGYDLSHSPPEAHCPECGEQVAQSVATDLRSGPAWLHRRQVGHIRAYLQTSLDAFVRPERLGRQIRLHERGADHVRFLVLHLLPIVIISTGGAIGLSVANFGPSPFGSDGEMVILGAVVIGSMIGIGSVIGTTAVAGLVALGYWLRERSPLMPAALQAGCYLAGWLTIWITVAWISAAMISSRIGLVAGMGGKSLGGTDPQFLAWTALMFGCAALYILALWHAAGAARYANR